MHNNDKTVALSLIALLVCIIFIWRGMEYEPSSDLSLPSIDIPSAIGVAPQSTGNSRINGVGPSAYLTTLGLTVYTDDEFASLFGGTRIFTKTPRMSIFAYLPTAQGDAIVWHDGKTGYICIDYLNMLLDQHTSLAQTYTDMCKLYTFDLYLAAVNNKKAVYARRKKTISDYMRQTGTSVDITCDSLDDFISKVKESNA